MGLSQILPPEDFPLHPHHRRTSITRPSRPSPSFACMRCHCHLTVYTIRKLGHSSMMRPNFFHRCMPPIVRQSHQSESEIYLKRRLSRTRRRGEKVAKGLRRQLPERMNRSSSLTGIESRCPSTLNLHLSRISDHPLPIAPFLVPTRANCLDHRVYLPTTDP